VTLWDALPGALFLIAFVAICLYLDRSHTVLFVRPGAFWLTPVLGWVWWMHVAGFSGLPRVRGTIALLTRLTLTGVFIMLLAEPRSVRTSENLTVVYAIDISDSIGNEATNQAIKFTAETASKKPTKDQAGLLFAAKNAAVELPPRMTFVFEAINTQIDRDATNLEQALSLSAAMIPEEDQGRIVLISDGVQTEGSLSRILDDLKAKGIAVDVLPIEYHYDREVFIERLDLPQAVKLGETYETSIVLSSLSDGDGTLTLRENGEVVARVPVEFQAGKNRYNIPISLRQAGYYEYIAAIETDASLDRLEANNRVVNSIFVEGEGQVLIVVDPAGEPRDSERLALALKEGKRNVSIASSDSFPRDPSQLLSYDCIIFCNVAADNFDAIQLQALHDGVRNFGIGFLMVGGANSFGPGGYHRTAVEEALPVTMDITQKKVLPKGALVIVLHTCEFADGNTWAKRITKQAIKVLGAQDEVGVIDYENGEKWVFKLTPASEYEKMVTAINGAEPGDMPSFTGTMRMGLQGLKESDASAKHMIIISDGDPQPPPPELVKEFKDLQITCSMVAIFPHGGQEISTMRAIAQATGGRYYFPDDPSQLPRIFIKESKTLKRSMIQTRTFAPEVHLPSSVLKGIDSMPSLRGYVLTSAKPESQVVLRAPPDPSATDDEKGDIDPVLAVWRYGLGSTAAWTSDLAPNWAADWMTWERYQAFVTQLVTAIARVRKEGHLRMRTYAEGNEGVIVVEDFAPKESFLDVAVRVAGPRDRVETLTLKQVAPRRYQASLPLWGTGRYHVMASGTSSTDKREEFAAGGIIVPYSPEYLRFRSNPIVLREIASRTGGVELTSRSTADDIYLRDRKVKRTSRPVFDWFLIALACLLPLDVAIRRVQIDIRTLMSLLQKQKKMESTATMGALLQRKQDVSAQFASRKGDSTLPAELQGTGLAASSTRPRTPTVAGSAASAASKPPERKPAAVVDTTTSRLLELKRKRQQD
jgi:uncharacterized membrane protein